MRGFITRIAERGKRLWRGKLQSVTAWNERRSRVRQISEKLFDSPFVSATTDGREVKLFRAGIKNLHGFEQGAVRPIVFCTVGNALLPFYKSTGTTGRKGQWLPFKVIRYEESNGQNRILDIVKFENHPNFPRWVEEVSSFIKSKEQGIQFENWGLREYLDINEHVFRTKYRIKRQKIVMKGAKRVLKLE